HRARERETLEVVADQWGSPTSGLDLADGILHAAGQLGDGAASYGVYHLAGSGSTSRADQARAVLEASARLGGPRATVRDVGSAAGGGRAARPRNSALSSERFAAAFGWPMPDWRSGVETVVARLLAS